MTSGLRIVRDRPQPLAEHDDDALMLLARGGVSAAFDELLRRHQARVLKVASKQLGELALARDIAQETFLEIYRALPRYQARGRFTAYLYQVLLNRCRMAMRQRRSERAAFAAVAPTEAKVAPDSEERILARERRREVERALHGLSEKLRSVVVLRFGAELSYDDIAATLDIPIGTVKRRLFDGLEKLRRNVGPR
jgi:RNA polymerase sigma-70 factor (ECF subfamily)